MCAHKATANLAMSLSGLRDSSNLCARKLRRLHQTEGGSEFNERGGKLRGRNSSGMFM